VEAWACRAKNTPDLTSFNLKCREWAGTTQQFVRSMLCCAGVNKCCLSSSSHGGRLLVGLDPPQPPSRPPTYANGAQRFCPSACTPASWNSWRTRGSAFVPPAAYHFSGRHLCISIMLGTKWATQKYPQTRAPSHRGFPPQKVSKYVHPEVPNGILTPLLWHPLPAPAPRSRRTGRSPEVNLCRLHNPLALSQKAPRAPRIGMSFACGEGSGTCECCLCGRKWLTILSCR
jgi:hypothetical protein